MIHNVLWFQMFVSDMIMNVRHSEYLAKCGHDTDYIA